KRYLKEIERQKEPRRRTNEDKFWQLHKEKENRHHWSGKVSYHGGESPEYANKSSDGRIRYFHLFISMHKHHHRNRSENSNCHEHFKCDVIDNATNNGTDKRSKCGPWKKASQIRPVCVTMVISYTEHVGDAKHGEQNSR